MIALLGRYIAKTVIASTLLVVLVVTALSFFINFLGELRDIGVGDYGIIQAAAHALLNLPHTIYQFFPMLVLLGGVLGLGNLAAHQELIVMRISGLSVPRIMAAVLAAALLLIVIGLTMGEVIAPHLYYLANQHKSMAQNAGQAVITDSGVWVHEDDNFIHIVKVMPHHHLEGVTRYEFDASHKLLTATYVQAMDYINKQWVLHKLVKTTFGNDTTTQESALETHWDLALNPNLLNVGLVEPEEMPLLTLLQYTRHLTRNGLQANEFKFDFWKRVLQPLTILMMLVLAVPFVFVSPRSVTMGWRMVGGILCGFVFYILSGLFGQVSIVFQISPFLAALMPILLFAGLGYLLMRRI
jgi:lipopolysaccharide export system permease protein